MSHCWDVHCVDCDEGLGLRLNHGEDRIVKLIEAREAIELLAGHGFNAEDDWGIRIDAAWFKRHWAHVLRARDEYGSYLGQCLKSTDCNFGHKHACQLDHDHEGYCSGRRRGGTP